MSQSLEGWQKNLRAWSSKFLRLAPSDRSEGPSHGHCEGTNPMSTPRHFLPHDAGPTPMDLDPRTPALWQPSLSGLGGQTWPILPTRPAVPPKDTAPGRPHKRRAPTVLRWAASLPSSGRRHRPRTRSPPRLGGSRPGLPGAAADRHRIAAAASPAPSSTSARSVPSSKTRHTPRR